VVVAGGAGLTGRCAVRDLARNNKISQIVVADFDAKAMERLEKEVQDPRIVSKKVDVRKHDSLITISRGSQVIVNAVQYYFNLDVMVCALSAGVNYIDFGGLFHMTLKQIRFFHKKFEKRKILGVPGMGAQPGISNLMVKHSLSFLDKADTIEIRDGWRDNTRTSSPIYFTWSPQTFFDESSLDAIVFRNGRYLSRPPFSEPETVTFPKPVGTLEVYLALHSELATIPKSFEKYGIKNVSWKEGSPDFWKIKYLADLGLTSTKETKIDGAKVSPRKLLMKLLASCGLTKIPENVVPDDFEITRVNTYGTKDSKEKKVVVDCFFPAFSPWKASCSQYNVGIAGSIAAQKLLKMKEPPIGVLPPELVFDPKNFFQDLQNRGITVKHEISDIEGVVKPSLS
jgi:lysine 6-dehydrogenase